jgi:hypothetical protein
MTPSLPDQVYARYKDAVATGNNPMGGIKNGSYDNDQVPRGSFPCRISIFHYVGGQLTDKSPESTDATDYWEVVINTVVTEPLFLSPFIFGDPEYNSQGIMGINNMVFTMNIDANLNRMFSAGLFADDGTPIPVTIKAGTIYHPSIDAQEEIAANNNLFQAVNFGGIVAPAQPTLLVKFLSVQPSDVIQPKNVVPYMSYPRYITSSAGGAALAARGKTTITSSNLQLNQLPDLFIITVRKPMSAQRITDANFFLKIQNISVNLNNQSGLIASASPEQLWRISQKNGSTQNWLEFSGISVGNATEGGVTGIAEEVGTTGSMLVLDPAYDLSLPDYLSSGSLGNYNFQFQITVYNQSGQAFVPEVCVICCNSGVMVTDRGTTQTYTGILTKDMVLSAKGKSQDTTSAESHRLVGGSIHNMGSSVKKHHTKTAHSAAAHKKGSKLDGFF